MWRLLGMRVGAVQPRWMEEEGGEGKVDEGVVEEK